MAKSKKRDDEIVHIGGNELAAMPDFMLNEEVLGTSDVASGIMPPFVKIVQRQSSQDLVDDFGMGAVILTPHNFLVADAPDPVPGPPILINPLLFWKEFCTWNDINLRGTAPAILDRSFDITSKVARKARNPNTYKETVDGKTLMHVEHLNFLCRLINVPGMEDQRVLFSFQRAEYKSGSKLCSLISMRKNGASKAPIYGCVFQLRVNTHRNSNYSWYGFDVDNPHPEVGSPWITDAEEYAMAKAEHEEFNKLYKSGGIAATYDDDGDGEGAGSQGEF